MILFETHTIQFKMQYTYIIFVWPSTQGLSVVEPLDYEKELLSHHNDLLSEKFPNLFLFPKEDVTVCASEPNTFYTHCSPSTFPYRFVKKSAG